MKTLIKLRDLAACIMEALLTDPLNSRICYTVIILTALWLAFVVSQIIIFQLFGLSL